MDLQRFRKTPVLGILRTSVDIPVEALIDVVAESGLVAIEITMNSANAPSLIKRAVKSSDGRLMVGAGTVLTTEILKEALDAGATFAVMPTLIEEVVEYCTKNIIPAFPGAMTPQEVYNAWKAGATMVKVFPAAMFGPAYISELKAPFENIELLACGGVTPDNIKSYFSNGASAVAFGASIFRKEWLDGRDFKKISHAIRELLDNAR